MHDMSERTYERRCESCIHFVPYPESEEFDICKIQGSCHEIYRELPYDKCTEYVHVEPVAAEIFKAQNHDAVSHPAHYTSGGIECIDCIKAALGENFMGFLIGNVIKYSYRYKDKNGVEDLKKARWYLDRAIKELENAERNDNQNPALR